jgi:hypothetical protein
LIDYLELVEVEGGVDDPSVPGPLVALVGAHAAVQQPLELPEADLLEVACI